MLNIAKETSYALANAYSIECWGGATFDVAMRFLYEDPWDRLVSVPYLGPTAKALRLVARATETTQTGRTQRAVPGLGSWC